MAGMPPYPDDFGKLLDDVARHAERFAAHARTVDLDAEVWIFDSAGPARFWLRQTIMEVALHVWDAARTVGHPSPLTPEIAVEGLEQFCVMQHHRGRWWGDPWTPPVTPFGITATDTGASWLMFADGDRGSYQPGRAAEAPVRATAPAESLYLWFAGREAPDDVEIVGDPAVAQAWLPQMA